MILLKAETRERVAILGVKSSRYLCMDLEGNPFSSVSQRSVPCRIVLIINLTDPLEESPNLFSFSLVGVRSFARRFVFLRTGMPPL